MSFLKSLTIPPSFSDPEKTQAAKILYTVLLILSAAAILGLIMGLVFNRRPVTINVSIALVIMLLCLWLTRRGNVNMAATTMVFTLIVVMTSIAYSTLGIHAHSILTFTFILVIASLILEDRVFIAVTILCVGVAAFLTGAEMQGMIITPMSEMITFYDFFGVSVIFVITAVFTRFFANNIKHNLHLAQQNEQNLRLLNQHLAQREAETNHFLQNLQTLYEISLELSRVETLPQLYQQAVELGRSELGFDRLALLLFDPPSGDMMGTFGTNEQGEVVDQSYFREPPFPYMLNMLNQRPGVFLRQDEPLHFAGKEVGTGWNTLTILWNGDKGVGWLTTDNLVRQEPIIPYQLEILTLYGSTIGHLITLKRQEEMVNSYAHELEASNQELEQFAYAASHDLQEPLRKIQLFGERLAANYQESLDERGQNYIARMQDAASRMQQLIEDLLTLSRFSTRMQPFSKVNLDTTLKEILQVLETRIEQTQAVIHADRLATIEADPTQMRQLLQNLLSNALKFTRPDVPPEIDVTCQEQMVEGRKLVSITVQDNGIGFDEQYSARIFAAFQRLHTRDEYEGSGIGLALCARIVERHNGRITARSKLGEGAAFIVTLPIHQE